MTQRIAIVGTGVLAQALASALKSTDRSIALGSRLQLRGQQVGEKIGCEGGSYQDAVANADVVILAALWEQVPGILSTLRLPHGIPLIDATNPEGPSGQGLVIGHSTSGAEQIALMSRAAVVKAFNSVYAGVIASSSRMVPRPAGFYCGDDAHAKGVTARLIQAAGLDAIDAGALVMARLLEPAAALMVQLVRGQGYSETATALALSQEPHEIQQDLTSPQLRELLEILDEVGP